jgi:hypothetical protein
VDLFLIVLAVALLLWVIARWLTSPPPQSASPRHSVSNAVSAGRAASRTGRDRSTKPSAAALPAVATMPVPPQRKARRAKKETSLSAEDDLPLSRGAGLSFWMTYEDAAGDESERGITIRRVQSKNDVAYVDAWCHLRGALRSFRADRIVSLADARTGEVLQPLAGELMADMILRLAAAQTVSDELRNSLLILAYLMRCDGVDLKEVLVFEAFAAAWRSHLGFDQQMKTDDIIVFALKLTPLREDLEAAIVHCAKKLRQPAWNELMQQLCSDMVVADGKTSEAEAAALLYIRSGLKWDKPKRRAVRPKE